jgi:uncharacterized protein (TIGR02147 family)
MAMYDFDDYRAYLRAHLDSLPNRGRGEINRIAQHAGVHPSLVSQVLSDSKNFSLEQAQLIAEYLGLTTQETEYFLLLVQVHRAGTEKLRTYFRTKLLQLHQASIEINQRVRQDRQLSEEEKSIFYSHWLYAAIWLLTSIEPGKSLDDVSVHFQIARDRANEILQFLVSTQLCLFENGRFRMGPQSIHLARGSVHLTKHHTNWRLRSIEMSDKVAAEELMYTAPISLSKADFKKIRGRLADVIKEVTDQAIKSQAEDIACVNIDFFWIRRGTGF